MKLPSWLRQESYTIALEKPLIVNTLDDSDIELLIRMRNQIRRLMILLGDGSARMLAIDSNYSSKLIVTADTTSNIAGYSAPGIGDIQSRAVNNDSIKHTLGTAQFMGTQGEHILNRFEYTSSQRRELQSLFVDMFRNLQKCRHTFAGTIEFPVDWLGVINIDQSE